MVALSTGLRTGRLIYGPVLRAAFARAVLLVAR